MKTIQIAFGVVVLSSLPSYVLAQDANENTVQEASQFDNPPPDITDPFAPSPNPAPEIAPPPALDPENGCTPYFHRPVADALASFPAVWQEATIVENDANARAKWDSIKGSVPAIPPKGTTQGDFAALNYQPQDEDCWWTFSKCTTPKHENIPRDIEDVPEPSTVGYGFDDGPNCSHNAFYDYLGKQNQKATMFFIGSNVLNWPLEALRAFKDGHEICIHGWSHHYMTGFDNEGAFAELYYAMQAVRLVAGVTPTCWRPPFGDVDDRIRAIANGLGLRTIMWQYDTNDWQEGINGVTAAKVDADYNAFIDAAKNGTFNTRGSILLAHELNAFTMQQAIKWYPQIKGAFKNVVPVGVAYNLTRPYVEQNVTMPSFEQYAKGTKEPVANTTINPGSPNLPAPAVPSVNNNAAQPQPTIPAATGGGAVLTMDWLRVFVAVLGVVFGGALMGIVA